MKKQKPNRLERAVITASERMKEIERPVLIYIGGYDGHRVLNYKEGMFKNAEIHVIEACPVNFKNMISELKGLNDIHLYQLAIAKEDGPLKFYTWNHRRGSSQSNSIYKKHLRRAKEKNIRKIKVEGMTLDTFVKTNKIEHIDLIKFNCEGSEYDTIIGDYLDIVDRIAVSFHMKNKIFNSDEFVEKRRKIYQHFESKGFILEVGERVLKGDRHIAQLWKKDGVKN